MKTLLYFLFKPVLLSAVLLSTQIVVSQDLKTHLEITEKLVNEACALREIQKKQIEQVNDIVLNINRNVYQKPPCKSKFTNGNFTIEHEGEITISTDDKDITSISKNGFLEVRRTTFGNKRKLRIESKGGKLVRSYHVGWREREYEPEGREWLEEILPNLVRTTTIGAKSRINNIYNRNGINGLTREMSKIKSDYVRKHYADIIIKRSLTEKDFNVFVQTIASKIGSDYYLSSLLKSNYTYYLKHPSSLVHLLEAAKSIDSDYYLSGFLKTLLLDDGLSKAVLEKLIPLIDEVDSDYYKSGVINSVVKTNNLSNQTLTTLIDYASKINSDYYMNSCFKAVAKRTDLSEKLIIQCLSLMSANMDSEYYLSNSLVAFVSMVNEGTEELKKAYRASAKTIQSNHYYAVAIRPLND